MELTTVKHEVTQRQLLLQELEVELKGSRDHNAGLQQQVDEYCSSIDKLEHELTITKQKHHIAIQEVIICVVYVYMSVYTSVHVHVCLWWVKNVHILLTILSAAPNVLPYGYQGCAQV